MIKYVSLTGIARSGRSSCQETGAAAKKSSRVAAAGQLTGHALAARRDSLQRESARSQRDGTARGGTRSQRGGTACSGTRSQRGGTACSGDARRPGGAKRGDTSQETATETAMTRAAHDGRPDVRLGGACHAPAGFRGGVGIQSRTPELDEARKHSGDGLAE